VPRRYFRSVHSGSYDLGGTAVDVGNYVDVCTICADFKGFDDL
jgi:hypothetical protein